MLDCLNQSLIPLRDYQKNVSRYLDTNDSILLVFGTGTGKTLTSIAAAECFLSKNYKNNIIIVCPKSVRNNFYNEFEKYGVKDISKYTILTYAKLVNKNKKGQIKTENNKFEEYTHEDIERIIEQELNEVTDSAKDDIKENLGNIDKDLTKSDDILCNKNTMLILDEIHNARNFYSKGLNSGKTESQRYNSIMALSKKAGKRILMTATPFINSVKDFAPIINFLYAKEVSKPSQFISDLDVNPIKKFLDQKVYYISKDSKDSKDEYPSYTKNVIEIPLSPSQELKYKEIVENFETENAYLINFRRAVNELSDIYNSKMKIKFSKFEKIIQTGKTLIYSNFKEHGIVPLSEFLSNKKISYKLFSGETPERERADIIKLYNDDKIDVLVITKAGCEGIDLKGTKNVIIMDPSFNPGAHEQIVGRAIRYKSHSHLPPKERHVNIYYVMLVGKKIKTGDQILYNIIEKKEKIKILVTIVLTKLSIKFDKHIKQRSKTGRSIRSSYL